VSEQFPSRGATVDGGDEKAVMKRQLNVAMIHNNFNRRSATGGLFLHATPALKRRPKLNRRSATKKRFTSHTKTWLTTRTFHHPIPSNYLGNWKILWHSST